MITVYVGPVHVFRLCIAKLGVVDGCCFMLRSDRFFCDQRIVAKLVPLFVCLLVFPLTLGCTPFVTLFGGAEGGSRGSD